MSELLPHQNLGTLLAPFYERSSLDADDGLVEELETLFKSTDFDDFDFHQFIVELIKTPYWISNDYPNNKIKDLCLRLSKYIEISYRASLDEPAYHSRLHFKDVCLGLTVLLGTRIDLNSQSNDLGWRLEKKDAWILLLTAIAHDFCHDGRLNHEPFEMERISLDKLNQWMKISAAEKALIQELMTYIEPLILATDPKYFHTLLQKISNLTQPPAKIDRMGTLLVEADLMASALPKRGLHLGRLLAKEWEKLNPQASLYVQSKQGRLGFLVNILFLSPQSQILGIERVRISLIDQIRAECAVPEAF